MSVCPKCKSKVKSSDSKCRKCGARLKVVEKPSGTLDAGQYLDLQAEQPPASKPTDESDAAASLNHSVEPVSTDESAKAEVTAASGEMPASDEHKTLDLPSEDNDPGPTMDSGTFVYSDSDLNRAMGKTGTGSSGQLKRVWEEAIGSSGKDSHQSLRHERAEASDSVFSRVSTRVIMDANAEETEGADYVIKIKLGDGGMGIVFSAKQTAVNRIVAIKTIRAEKRNEETTRRQFFYEAEITAGLDHPNIPPIYELGQTKDGVIFYSMKLIDGTEWQAVIKEKSREDNLEIFSKMVDAVAFAHSKGVIHRDLKPANVMLGTFGEVYVTDWGLAVDQAKKKPGPFGGTPDFMAPEMALNQRSKIGKPSDIYLLGGILFQIVTGGPPHIGRTSMDRLKAATRNEIAPTDKEDPLLEIAHRAMATEPSNRYASVEEMREALQEVTRHAESIALANRSEDLAEAAAVSKDYDRFTRAVFGFRDAIELWDGNKPAAIGLQKARLAYGQCAFDKGDYDLAVQTLDRNEKEEAKVYDKAVKAKIVVQQRESRFKALMRTFAVAVLAFLCIATGLAGFAMLKWRGEAVQAAEALRKTEIAESEAENARISEGNAKNSEANAVIAKTAAEKAEAKSKADEMIARTALAKSIADEKIARAAETKSKEDEMIARTAESAAKISEAKAVAAELIAKERAAKIKLSDSASKLGKAKLGIEQLDIQNSSGLLSSILQSLNPTDESEFGTKIPKFDTFALQRAKLLTNADLPQQPIGSATTAMDFATNAKVAVFGTAKGIAKIVRYEADRLVVDDAASYKFPDGADGNPVRIEGVSISPNGDEAIVTTTTSDKKSSTTYFWPLAAKQTPIEAKSLAAWSFQTVKYSPDGTKIAVGINSGITILPAGGKWAGLASKNGLNFPDVRGRLEEIQWIDSDRILARSNFNGKRQLFEMDIKTEKARLIELPPELKDSLTAAVYLRNGNRVLLASGDGTLTLGELVLSSQSADKKVTLNIAKDKLPPKHRAAISRLIASNDGQEVMSISDKEPVAHVWLVDIKGEMTYDTYLTGVPSQSTSTPNLVNAQFISKDMILGVDDSGTTVAWNVERQKQRRQLTRISEAGRQEEYAEPVVGVFGRGNSDQAISITADGVVDLWNLQTGKTKKMDQQRWSYFGHTPGALYVDSAVDMDQGVVITSAKLENAEKRYLTDASQDFEFCVWDQKTGNMLHRWSIKKAIDQNGKAEDIEPRISLLNDGKEMLISSNFETRIVTLDGREVFTRPNLGTVFAVTNPRDKSLVAMIKRSGFTWLWNRSDANSWPSPSTIYFSTEDKDGFPLKGVWSQDGNRLFVAYTDGFVKAYDLLGQKFSGVVWNSEVSEDNKKPKSLWRTGFHYDMDLATARVENSIDRLFVNVRSTQSLDSKFEGAYNGAVFDFPMGSAKPRVMEVSGQGTRWLGDVTDGQATLSRKVHNGFKLNKENSDSIRARFKSGDHTFVSTKSGVVYDLQDQSSQLKSLGNTTLIDSSSNRDGNMIVTLHNDGSLWRFELTDEDVPNWKKMDFNANGFKRILLSPNSKQLALLDTTSNTLKVLDAVTGVAIQEFDNIESAIWDPTLDASLATCSQDGKLEIATGNEKKDLGNADLANGAKVKSLNFFVENFQNPEVAQARYVLVHSEVQKDGQGDSYLQFIRTVPNAQTPKKMWPIGGGVERIATSAVDSIIATGNKAGTLTIWFASPTWDNLEQLFDLEGHRGASFKSLAFSRDGQTLISSDSNKRLFGWLSKDKTKVSTK